jgi:hypothetical protein
MSRIKNSWKLLVLIALVSSIVFCSEVCADPKCEQKAVKAEQKEGIKAIKADPKCEQKEVKAEQKEGIKVIPAERKCEGKAVQEQQKDN